MVYQDLIIRNVSPNTIIRKSELSYEGYYHYIFELTAGGSSYRVKYSLSNKYVKDKITYKEEEIMETSRTYTTTEEGIFEFVVMKKQYNVEYD